MNSFFFHVACLPGLVRSNIHSFIRSGQSEHWRTPRRQLLCGLQASYIESCFGSTTSFNCEMFKLQSRPCWNSNDYQWRTDRTDDSIGDSPLLTLPASPARILMTNKLLNVPCPLCLACVCVCVPAFTTWRHELEHGVQWNLAQTNIRLKKIMPVNKQTYMAMLGDWFNQCLICTFPFGMGTRKFESVRPMLRGSTHSSRGSVLRMPKTLLASH